jgi:hypothetical protein
VAFRSPRMLSGTVVKAEEVILECSYPERLKTEQRRPPSEPRRLDPQNSCRFLLDRRDNRIDHGPGP